MIESSKQISKDQCYEFQEHPKVRGLVFPEEMFDHLRLTGGYVVIQLKSEEDYLELQAKLHSSTPTSSLGRHNRSALQRLASGYNSIKDWPKRVRAHMERRRG